MADLKEAFESLSLFDKVPQEILCQIIEQFGTPILIDDLNNLRSAYPNLSTQFNSCVTEIDFTNGALFTDRAYDGRLVDTVWDLSYRWEWAKLEENYPRLRQYRIAVFELQGENYNDVFQFIADPRARWLYVSIVLAPEREKFPLREFYQALSSGVSERIKRYGADFTIVIRVESYVDLAIGFVYKNGSLTFENAHQNPKLLTRSSRRQSQNSTDEEPMDSNFTIQVRIIEIFQPVIQILGARSSRNLSELFENYRTTLLKSVTKISLNQTTNGNFDYISNRGESAFFRFLTEIHHNPYIDGVLHNIPDITDDSFLEELEAMNVIYPRITVMELPISVYSQPDYQRFFPNVTKFVYLEQLEIDYHKQEIAELEKYLQNGLEQLENPDVADE
jgi:hypothetical protein